MKIKVKPIASVFKLRGISLAVRQALPYLLSGSIGLAAAGNVYADSAQINAAYAANQLVRQFTLKNSVAQVNLGIQSYVVDNSGTPLAPAMGATIAGFLPSDMGTVPASGGSPATNLGLPQRDGAGRPLGYCAWNNLSSTSNSSYLAGLGAGTPMLYAVVSAGLNGRMETSCAYILSRAGSGQPLAAGDDYVEFRTPYSTASTEFKTSVANATELLSVSNPSEGEVRLVRDINRLYAYRKTGINTYAWAPVSTFSDDSAANGPNAVKYLDGKVTVADFAAATANLSGNLTGTTATFSGGVLANSFSGSASGLTDLNASNVSSGVLAPAFGGTGVDASAAAPGTLLIGNGSGFSLGTLTAGNGMSIVSTAGGIAISNTGVLSLTGTADQVIVSSNKGDVTLSLPQSISSTSSPSFAGLALNGGLTGTTATFSGNLNLASISQGGVPATLAFEYASDTGDSYYNQPNLALGTGALAGAKRAGNVAIGGGVLGQLVSSNIAQYGSGNSGVGYGVLSATTTGAANSAMGAGSMASNLTGDDNSALGVYSLSSNTAGFGNTAVGMETLKANTTGLLNTAIGRSALFKNIDGHYNTATGTTALYNNTSGMGNVAVGYGAMLSNTIGTANTALGTGADVLSGNLNFATALGGSSRVSTSNTVVLGALSANKGGVNPSDSIVIGATGTASSGILQNKILQVTGDVGISGNLAIGGNFTASSFTGDGSGLTNLNAGNISTGVLPVARGGTGLSTTPTNGKLLIGNGTGYTLANITGTANQVNVANGAGSITLSLPQAIATTSTPTFGGMNLNGNLTGTTATFSGQLNATDIYSNGVQLKPITKANIDAALTFASDTGFYSDNNLALGSGALGGLKSAGNVAIGEGVLGQISNADFANANTGVGYNALYSNTTGYYNTASGYQALYSNTTGDSNVASGAYALASNTAGDSNVASGFRALNSNTIGGSNVASGYQALYSNTNGDSNVASGASSLYFNTTGYNNVAIGAGALYFNTRGSRNTALGYYADVATSNLSYATALGAYSQVSSSNTVVLGRTTDTTVIGATGTASSGILQNKILQVTGDVGISGNIAIGGNFTAAGFSGDGSGLTNLSFSQITGGLLGTANGGTGLDGSAAANGQLLIGNGSGYSLGYISGTANQVNVVNSAGGISLSLPQDIATTSSPTFGGLKLNGNLNGTTAAFSGNVNVATVNSLALRQFGNNVGVGSSTLARSTTLNNNVAVGANAILGGAYGGGAINNGVAVGYNAMSNLTTGDNNTAIGYNTYTYRQSGSNNTLLGASAQVGNDNLTYATAIGAGSYVYSSSTVVLGRTSDTVVIGANSKSGTAKLQVTGDAGISGSLAVGGSATFSGNVSTGGDTLTVGQGNAGQTILLNDVAGAKWKIETPGYFLGFNNDYGGTFEQKMALSKEGNLTVVGSGSFGGALTATSVTQTSDRRLKTNIQTLDNDQVLAKLAQLSNYSYNYIEHPELGRKIGVIAQEVQPLFPEAVVTTQSGFYAVDYNALGAMAAVGVGKLSVKYKALDTELKQQGKRIGTLENRVDLQDTRLTDLESWKTQTEGRLGTMQQAIDTNMADIAAHALKIASNTERVTTLEQVTDKLDARIADNAKGVSDVKAVWNNTFEMQGDGQTLALKIPNFKVSNFSAEQVKANAVYAQRLQAEVAKIKSLQVEDLYARNATAQELHADEFNTGTTETYAGVGNPAFLFAAKADGHYTVNTSSPDGSYATATVIVYGGVAKVVPVAQQGIELFAVGNQVKANAAGKSIKASWLKMG